MTVRAARGAGELELARQLDQLRDRDAWLDYSIAQFKAVQEIGSELGLPVHLWPDRQHIKYANDEVSKWLQAWKDRPSPEPFAGRRSTNKPTPPLPNRLS